MMTWGRRWNSEYDINPALQRSISLCLRLSVLSFPVHTLCSGGDGVLPEFVKDCLQSGSCRGYGIWRFPFSVEIVPKGQYHSFKADEDGWRLGP